MVDVTKHLNVLNKRLRGCNKVVAQHCDRMRSFKLKPSLWEVVPTPLLCRYETVQR